MEKRAVVIKTDGEVAEVSVLREEACSHCAGRAVCGTAKMMTVVAKNQANATVGDVVMLESPSKNLLGYAALVFFAPVALAVIAYLVFSLVNPLLAVIMTALSFVAPFIVAMIIDKMGREARLPVITEIIESKGETPPCDNAASGL